MKTKFYLFLLLTPLSISAWCQSPWIQINVPHPDSSYFTELDIPNANSVWGVFNINDRYSLSFAKSADAGATWTTGIIATADTLSTISNLMPLSATTCYATIASAQLPDTTSAKGIYKTTDGGLTWERIGVGTIYTSPSSFPDFTYF